jgi:hypothetical protein
MVPARSGTRVGGMGRHQILDEGHLRGSRRLENVGRGTDNVRNVLTVKVLPKLINSKDW